MELWAIVLASTLFQAPIKTVPRPVTTVRDFATLESLKNSPIFHHSQDSILDTPNISMPGSATVMDSDSASKSKNLGGFGGSNNYCPGVKIILYCKNPQATKIV